MDDTLFITVTLFTGTLGLFYIFLIWNYGSWKKRGVREVKTYPGLGSFPSAFTQKRHMVYDMDDVYRKYKNSDNFVGVYSSRSPQLFITDPELVHKIYVNDFKCFHDNEFAEFVDAKSDLILSNNPFVLKGELWKERRMEMIPGMSPNRIKNSFPITLEVCKRLTNYVKEHAKVPNNTGLETQDVCLRYTAEVVSDCVLGIHGDALTDKPSPLFGMVIALFQQTFWFLLYQILVGLLPSLKYFYKVNIFSKSSEKYFFGLMTQAIEMRRKQGDNSRVDFLNYLLQLQDKKNMTTNVMISNIMTFLTDGFITTSLAISHCLLGLARNPEAQEKLREEILQNVNSDGVVTFETLSEMPYLEACFNESLRIFPPLLFVTKSCTQPYEFVNKNGKTYQMKPKEVVLISQHSLHHDERFYEDPEEYKPERFLPENGGVKKYREEGKFLGFGDGPRICFGMRFALTQGKAAVVELVRNFHIKVNPKTRSDNLLDKKEFLGRLEGGIWLDYEPLE